LINTFKKCVLELQ